MREFRKQLFSRIVPNIKRIGMWGTTVEAAFRDIGVLEFQDLEPDALSGQDEQREADLDRALALRAQSDANGVTGRAGEVAATILSAE
jgi:hypothetical protein